MSPDPFIIDYAVRAATRSPCQSKRGAAVFTANGRVQVLSGGYNEPPPPFLCDGSDACKAVCGRTAVHAEQGALLKLRRTSPGPVDMLHVKAVDGLAVPSGPPSCVECSKLMLAAGIAGMWLLHADGWRRYEMDEFHRLTLETRGLLR